MSTVSYWKVLFICFYKYVSSDSFCRMSDDGLTHVTRRHNGFVGDTGSSYVAVLWTFDEAASTWLWIGRVEKGRVGWHFHSTLRLRPSRINNPFSSGGSILMTSLWWSSWRKNLLYYISDCCDPPPSVETIMIFHSSTSNPERVE
jgi:hypothetical protein